MFRNVRKVLRLVGGRTKRHLGLLIALALVVSAAETLSALLILSVFRPLVEPDAPLALPFVGPVADRLPGLSESVLQVLVVVLVAIAFVLRGALFVGQTYAQQRVSQNVGVRLSDQLVSGYLRQPYAFHLGRNSAELIRRALQSATTVGSVVLVSYVSIASETMMVLALLALLVITAPAQTLLLILAVGPVVLVMSRAVRGTLTRYSKRNIQHFQQALQSLQQALSMVREIHVSGRADHFGRTFTSARADYARNSYLGTTLSEVPRVTLESTLVITVVVFIAVAAAREDKGQALAELALFGYAALRILPALGRIVTAVNRLRLNSASLEDVQDDLELLARTSPPVRTAPVSALPFTDRLELRDVWFRYSDEGPDVLRGMSMVIRRGESIGIVGPTGAGKSTLLDVLLALLRPTAGTVAVDGVDAWTDPARWHANIGLVSQSVVLIDDTLRRNIALGLADDAIDEALLQEAVLAARLDEVVVGLEDGLDTRIGERGTRLSGGQRQRVAIARALYGRPSVLVFDEGTSSLDTITEREILSALERLHGERTLVTVAHRLATVRSCERIYIVNEGRVTDEGTYDELVERSGQFREMAR